MCNCAAAQDALRLWKPYTPESFGGGRRTNDGIYASLSGIYWTISAPRGGYIGATTASGNEEHRYVLGNDGATIGVYQANTLSASLMKSGATLGTRFEVGNRVGHHGWLVSAYSLPTRTYGLYQKNAALVFRDEGNFRFSPAVFMNSGSGTTGSTSTGTTSGSGIEHIFVWNKGTNSYLDSQGKLPYNDSNFHYLITSKQSIKDTNQNPQDIDVPNTIPGIGYLWGWYVVTPPSSSTDDSSSDDTSGSGTTTNTVSSTFAVLAPVPVSLRNVTIDARSKHQSAELLYTYRPHPFSWGSIEWVGGLKYWDFDDRFTFGSGPKTQSSSTDTGSDTDTDTDTGTTDTTEAPAAFSAITALNFRTRAQNRIFGPQIGIKMNRQNARWTFFVDARLTAGINMQSINLAGDLVYAGTETSATDSSTDDSTTDTSTSSSSNVTLIGVDRNLTDFGHKQNKNYISPIVQFRFGADWQWTESVSVFGAFDTMYANNIARGYRVPDYVVKPGTLFGIRGNDHNASVMVYGIEAGIKLRR
ncbi:MAG: BBP7 family outer membrane beta-barrel protein [Planctomycetaceae bacterium]|nr:BBP7 family outer membrane beta-barrel protein [Planctomycetaceae bacterium]